jgi:hypothetical protein
MAPKQDKAAAKEAARAKREASRARRRQIFEAFNMQRKEDRWLIPLMAAAIVGATAVAFLLGLIWHVQWMVLPLGIALGALGAMILFGRRVQRTVYAKAEGQPGAAAWALENLRGRWKVSNAVAGTTQLDAVHRVIGRPGIVLVAEGAPHRVKTLLGQEKKRIARLIGDTPIYDVLVGNDENQVPLPKLQRHIMKLPHNISSARVDSLEKQLAALGSRGAAMPKGPMPQGAKMRNVQRAIRRR